jgi:TrkA domain protein
MQVQVTPLPGIGTRQDFVLREGRRVGVVTHRDGHIDLIVSQPDDPDACAAQVPLTTSEAGTLASLLGAPQLAAQLSEQQREVAGVSTRPLALAPGSLFDGGTLGDTAMRSRTGVSVVAVVRDGTVHPSPRPDFRFSGGDLLIAVGTPDGLDAAAGLLEG